MHTYIRCKYVKVYAYADLSIYIYPHMDISISAADFPATNVKTKHRFPFKARLHAPGTRAPCSQQGAWLAKSVKGDARGLLKRNGSSSSRARYCSIKVGTTSMPFNST